MQFKEKYGRRILNNCLPPIKFSVDRRGHRISITENLGRICYTTGKTTPGALKFYSFLQEKGVLEAFITKSFSGNVVSHIINGDKVLIGSWVRYSFSWEDNVHFWERISRQWNATLPSRFRERT